MQFTVHLFKVLNRVRERWHFTTFHPQLPILGFVIVLEETTRRRTRRTRAIFVIHASMTRTKKQAGLLEPTNGTTQVRAVDCKYLELRALNVANQAGMLAVSPSHGRVNGFRYTASLVWPSGKLSSGPSEIHWRGSFLSTKLENTNPRSGLRTITQPQHPRSNLL